MIINPDFFPDLIFDELQSNAAKWASRHPEAIKKIILYRSLDENVKYVLVVECPLLSSKKDDRIEKDDPRYLPLYEYLSWVNEPCSHIRQDLIDAHRRREFSNDWLWFHVRPGEGLPDFENEIKCWALYPGVEFFPEQNISQN